METQALKPNYPKGNRRSHPSIEDAALLPTGALPIAGPVGHLD